MAEVPDRLAVLLYDEKEQQENDMPRRPASQGPRPTKERCSCGSIFDVAPKGPIPERCPGCRDQDRFGLAIAMLRELPADLRLLPNQRDGEFLMEFGARLRRDGERARLEDAVEVIDGLAGRVDVEDAPRVVRRLNAARERIAYRAGLRR